MWGNHEGPLLGDQRLKASLLVVTGGAGDERCLELSGEAAGGLQGLVVEAVAGMLPWSELGVLGHAEVAVAGEAYCGTLCLL